MSDKPGYGFVHPVKIEGPHKPQKPPSSGAYIAALLSLLLPGLGQLIQGRMGKAVKHFLLAIVLWVVLCGWVMSIYSAYEAAKWDTKST